MDDIHLEDPRKFSAKQIKVAVEQAQKQRSFWQYLVDLTVKTFICAILISIDFTLFANAGSYNLFSSSLRLNIEAEYIYLAIFIFSFLLMFIASFFRSLENIVLALCFALMCIAGINQFAVFEKHSGLLIIFNGIFSENINTVLYEYSFWIIGLAAFVFFWLLLKLLRRQFMFYFMLGLAAVLGWILSEAYLNTSSQYFKIVAATPKLRSDAPGKNLVFLSFNSLTSPNNLRNMYNSSKHLIDVQGSFNNALGFYTRNKFILYPNAMVKDAYEPFLNLIAAYNPDSEEDVSSHVLIAAVRNDYFNFTALQTDRIYLKDSSLYNMLHKDDYAINIYQTRDIDTCYLNNKLAAASCREKINSPIAFNNGSFSTLEKSILLSAQWLNSTGFVSSLNPLLKLAGYIHSSPALNPMGFEVGHLYVMNSFKAFDQIFENIERQTGNQAYFAVIDLPSETYVYDEFCQLKDMPKWMGENNSSFSKNSIDSRRSAYAEQVSCLYGHLEKFIQQLDKSGHLKNTTIIIEGLNNPLGLNKNEKDFYRQIQVKNQVALAIRPADAEKAKIDYSVCGVNEILNSYFFSHKSCREFNDIKTTDKTMTHIKNLINQDKYKKHVIAGAQKSFDEWFMAWQAHNQFESNFKYQSAAVSNESSMEEKDGEEHPRVLDEVAVSEAVVEDVPEQTLKSIQTVSEETPTVVSTTEKPATVLPDEPQSEVGMVPEEPAETTEKAVSATAPAKNDNSVSSAKETEQNEEVKPVTAEQPVATKKNAAEKTEPEPLPEDETVITPETEDMIKTETMIEVEDITENEVKPSSDIKIEPEDNGEDVIPDTLFDDEKKLEKTTPEAAIAKAKQTVKAKAEKKAAEARKAEKKLDDLTKSIEALAKDDELRDVLEAPVAQGQKLSPEELKKQYHETLNQAAKKADSNVNIEIKVIEN